VRTRLHMSATLGMAIAMLEAQGSLAKGSGASAPSGRTPNTSPTRMAVIETGKPPMNGAREVARRLRQMQRKAEKDARKQP
jgi:hypothetical protein